MECEKTVNDRASSESTAMRYYFPPNLLDYQPYVDPNTSEISVSVEYLSSDGTLYKTVIQVMPLTLGTTRPFLKPYMYLYIHLLHLFTWGLVYMGTVRLT